MEVSDKWKFQMEVHKIIKCVIYCIYFSAGGSYDVMVKLPLIKQIVKDINLMCISFSVKHPQVSWKS